MSSRSMNYLRKNQKTVMAILCVVCMITFVVGPALLDMFSSPAQNTRDPVVVTWKGGKIRQSQINSMRDSHAKAVAFLQAVILESQKLGGSPVVFGQPIQFQWQLQNPGISGDSSEGAVVRRMLLAERARQLGITVDRQAVFEFLRQLGDYKLAEGDWLALAEPVLKDAQMSVNHLLDQVALELKAQHVEQLALAGISTSPNLMLARSVSTPGEMWEAHNRLNRRFSIEAYPVEVAPLVAQVGGQPTDKELRALFEEGKGRDPDPNRAEPGFHRPQRIAFEYLKIDFAPFLAEAKREITDEQIAKQYELGKTQGKYKEIELPPVEDGPPADKPPTDKPATDSPTDGSKPGENKPEETKPEDKSAEEKKPEENKPPEEKKPVAEDKASDANKPCGEEADQPAAPDKPAEKQAEKPVEKPVGENPAEAKPVETKPGENKPAKAQPGDEKPAEENPVETKPEESAPEPPKEPKYKPLDAVKDEILKELAQPIAQERRDAAIKEAIKEINEYAKKYRRWIAYKDTKPDTVTDPGRLPLEAIAAKYGFGSGSTPLVNRYRIDEYEIGQKVQRFDFQALQRGLPFQLRFADIAYGTTDPLYNPVEENSTEPDISYLYWRTQVEEPVKPTYEQAREDVLKAWKLQQAFKHAQTEAAAKAEKARSARSLKDVFDPALVITTPPFSWMTTGALGFGRLDISPVPGIELAGTEFMEAVFALKPGETGTAPNNAHTVVYVVRVLAQEPSDENLREQFLESGHVAFMPESPTWQISQVENQKISADFFKGLEKDMRLVWNRPEDDPERF